MSGDGIESLMTWPKDERVLEAERKSEIRKRIEERKKLEGRTDEDADDEDEGENGQMPGLGGLQLTAESNVCE